MADNKFLTSKSCFEGCDFVLSLGEERKGTPIRLLQLTDMQVIDAAQRRTPDRLRADEISAWSPENFMAQCGNHIASLVAQARPDLIFITGDIVYGSFDDAGTTFAWFCSFMDSFEIPWAPVFGNHDNESDKGVAWQCRMFEQSKYCLFRRGNVSGNGNYTVGIAVQDSLLRVLYMLDSNGCAASQDADVIKEKGLYPNQLDFVGARADIIAQAQGHIVPGLAAFHIPTDNFRQAEVAKGYKTEERQQYTIGVDVPAQDDDFGFCLEHYGVIHTDRDLNAFLHRQGIDALFAGHCHNICTSIRHDGIRFVFGLKSGQYDYHIPGSLGGTLVTLKGSELDVQHLPSLVPYAPMPGGSRIFDHFFAKT